MIREEEFNTNDLIIESFNKVTKDQASSFAKYGLK